jgi:hypothetical protein
MLPSGGSAASLRAVRTVGEVSVDGTPETGGLLTSVFMAARRQRITPRVRRSALGGERLRAQGYSPEREAQGCGLERGSGLKATARRERLRATGARAVACSP